MRLDGRVQKVGDTKLSFQQQKNTAENTWYLKKPNQNSPCTIIWAKMKVGMSIKEVLF